MSHDQEHNADPHGSRHGYILGNDYALPYLSKWSRQVWSAADSSTSHGHGEDVLRHLNCSYLSTPGQPPTLLALKQHAQSLARAITLLCPSDHPVGAGEVCIRDSGALAGPTGEPLDFLASLTHPYTNDDPDHHRQLGGLLNEISSRHDVTGTEYHCPLNDCGAARQREDGEPGRAMPYASHHNLLMHANACLERLDHELGAQGGILAIMPQQDAPHEAEQLRAARNTLLGQLLVFLQALVGRTHELEIQQANMADLLAGVALAPRQHLGSLGPDGRATGAPVAYPQDRWVLCNAGDDVLGHVHELLDRREALLEPGEEIWRAAGAMRDRDDQGGGEAGGIVYVDVQTRYYRLRGQTDGGRGGGGTVYVVPAWEHHPAVAQTVEAEARPTVVTVPNPHFPERVSVLHDRYARRIREGAKAADEHSRLSRMCETLQADVRALRQDGQRERTANALMRDMLGRDKAALADDYAKLKEDLGRAETKIEGAAAVVWQHEQKWKQAEEELAKVRQRLKKTIEERDKAKFAHKMLKIKVGEVGATEEDEGEDGDDN